MAKGIVSGTPHYIDRTEGALLWDLAGQEYIDFGGGIGVMNVGHSHPKVVAAIKEQAEKFTHTCFMVHPYASAVLLAKKLTEAVPGNSPKAAMFINSGAEAVENAVKISRYATKRKAIIVFEGAFHGRTYLGMTMTSRVKPTKLGFGPLVPEIYRMPYAYCYRCPFGLRYPDCSVACADHLNDFFISHVAAEEVAAVIAEPVQGEGGFVNPPPEYYPKLKAICEKHGILFIADEVQAGIGRTGTMFAIENWQVEADYRPRVRHALFLNWFRAGNYEKAYRETLHFMMPEFYWDHLLKASACGQLGKIEEGQACVQALLALKPDFARRGRILIGRYVKFEDIADRIIEGLGKLDLRVES